MTEDKGILIKNIYYMLSYAFRVLRQTNYEEIASENFEHIADLFAAILAKGISQQLKQGLYREYIQEKDNLPILRGKLDIYGTAKNQMQFRRLLACEYDELSEDNIFNRILKTTLMLLINIRTVKTERRATLKKVLLFFDTIGNIDPKDIRWDMLCFSRHNRNFEMLMNICYFVMDGMLQTTDKGKYKMSAFTDDHMARLYEKFVLEYYKQHHNYLTDIKAGQVKWNLDGQADEKMLRFLPVMQTDIMLRKDNRVLIIDTKYYGRSMQKRYDRSTLHSNNLYQIFAYVKNKDAAHSGNVSGLLLYAKTEEEVTPDCEFPMGGNRISVKTLDLNREFKQIARQLDEIVESHFEDDKDYN